MAEGLKGNTAGWRAAPPSTESSLKHPGVLLAGPDGTTPFSPLTGAKESFCQPPQYLQTPQCLPSKYWPNPKRNL